MKYEERLERLEKKIDYLISLLKNQENKDVSYLLNLAAKTNNKNERYELMLEALKKEDI